MKAMTKMEEMVEIDAEVVLRIHADCVKGKVSSISSGSQITSTSNCCWGMFVADAMMLCGVN